ncbi:MAG: uracil-DNA glycosylase [Acetobacteraceae bacterium]|nr:uracil-DNA glycosylase [Acetobacteraceae bacterium]
MIDDLTALRLQRDWGVDEALGERPVDRFAAATRPALPAAPRLAPAAATVGSGVRARTLEELHRELEQFEGCPLRATATHTVRPSGSPAAPVMLIGDAPGSDDDRSGQAFSGEAGAMVDGVLRSIGLDRSSVLLTTMVPWRPPGNRPASETEIQACLPFVHRLIGIVRPRVAVLLGAVPVAALTGQAGTIRQLRGRWIELALASEQTTVAGLPMLPLTQWLRDATTKQQLWSDLLLLQNRLATT